MKRIMAPVNYDDSDFDRTFNYESFPVDNLGQAVQRNIDVHRIKPLR